VVAILLDSSLLIAVSLPPRHSSPIQSDQANGSPLALLSTSAGAWAFFDGRYLSANMTTRGEIMAYILTNPGVYLREISDDLGLSLGAVQYHIWALTKAGQLEEFRSGRYRRFFGAARYQEAERIVLSLLRQGTDGRILATLAEEPLPHKGLAAALGLTSQALTWHMKRLRAMGLVETQPSGGRERWRYCLEGSVQREVEVFIGALPKPMLGMLKVPATS
jgi:DNA-binding transcriptional ArsR family regulator